MAESITKVSEFTDWLQNELNQQGWSQSDLARAAKVAQSGISMLFTQNRQPGPEVCRGIAKALGASEIFVFRKAGLLSPQVDYDFVYEEWRSILHELDPENRDELLQIARLRLERQRDEAWSHKFSELSPAQQEEVSQFMIRKGWIQKDVPTGSPDPRKSE